MRTMNVGDKAFLYHSNCKEPGIAGIMEIVKEFSPDGTRAPPLSHPPPHCRLSSGDALKLNGGQESALDPGAPYYDPASTREKPRWSLAHVEFRCKFAVPVPLRELHELARPGGPLEAMQMLRQPRLSVSRVSAAEWVALCRLADKAAAAGLGHQDA